MKTIFAVRSLGLVTLMAAAVSLVGLGAHAQEITAQPKSPRELDGIQGAANAIFEAFDTHPLVGISDNHGLAQEMTLYEEIIRDARFAREVGNVVVEFGGAARQSLIDRYVNGSVVPYSELRQVWTDTVGWTPTVRYLGYAHFFAQVREANLKLPPEKRIRVWLGEPPIIWSTVHTRDEYTKIVETRDSHAAHVIVDDILAKGRKALVIYGGYHFDRNTPEDERMFQAWKAVDATATQRRRLKTLVETNYPGAFFILRVYTGFEDAACTKNFERDFDAWPMPAIGQPAKGTRLERDLVRCGRPAGLEFFFPPNQPKEVRDYDERQIDAYLLLADAVLFLGPATSLTRSPLLPDLYLDEQYRAEISRQVQIKTGQPLPANWGRDTSLTTRFLN